MRTSLKEMHYLSWGDSSKHWRRNDKYVFLKLYF